MNKTFQIECNEREWRVWYEAEKPEFEEIPCGYHQSLDSFRKLLLIRSWCPDRTIAQAKMYIEGNEKLLDTIHKSNKLSIK